MRLRIVSLPTAPGSNTAQTAPWRRVFQTAERLWIYQRERFPLLGHGLLIGAFSLSAVSFSYVLRGGRGWPSLASLAVAFVSSTLFFLQLRIADEFKDFEEDARWRPYRPVPRGLVSLRELGAIAFGGGLVQLGLAWCISWRLAGLLLVVWAYLALMTREFFVREWILKRPITYLWTHMLIIPMADFYATACDWAGSGAAPPPGLFWFLAVSFCNGIALELGRKMRAPQDEEEGVRTYTLLWGRPKAAAAWWSTVLVTGACAGAAASTIDALRPVLVILGVLVLVAGLLALGFMNYPTTRRAKAIERFSGIWTLVMYLNLGPLPLFLVWARAAV